MILTAVMFYLHSASEGDAEHDIAIVRASVSYWHCDKMLV